MLNAELTGVERFFDDDQIIVSKTDLKGRLTYTNRVFIDISGYQERDLLGQPHNMIRHSDMPRCIFKLLWETIQGGNEIFAYVVNRCANGDHYWVYAHVTPSFDLSSNIVGYHSNRRVPDRKILDELIIPLYRDLKTEEERFGNRKDGLAGSEKMIADHLQQQNIAYDEWVATVGQGQRRGYR